jgi:hypothetical protein
MRHLLFFFLHWVKSIVLSGTDGRLGALDGERELWVRNGNIRVSQFAPGARLSESDGSRYSLGPNDSPKSFNGRQERPQAPLLDGNLSGTLTRHVFKHLTSLPLGYPRDILLSNVL